MLLSCAFSSILHVLPQQTAEMILLPSFSSLLLHLSVGLPEGIDSAGERIHSESSPIAPPLLWMHTHHKKAESQGHQHHEHPWQPPNISNLKFNNMQSTGHRVVVLAVCGTRHVTNGKRHACCKMLHILMF